jgi:hypothetical protein
LVGCSDGETVNAEVAVVEDGNLSVIRFKDGKQEIRVYRAEGRIRSLQVIETADSVTQRNVFAVDVDQNMHRVDEITLGERPLVVYKIDTNGLVRNVRLVSSDHIDSAFHVAFQEWIKLQPSHYQNIDVSR